MKANWNILRLMDLYRYCGHKGRMTASEAREIRYHEDQLKGV